MNENAIDNENISKPAPDTAKPRGAHKPMKKARPAKKAGRAKKAAAKPKTERANKKAEVITMMKRAKGATLAEIVKATGWQPHTVRGFVSILGSKGGAFRFLEFAWQGRTDWRVHMQVLALISLYAPAVIIILAVIAVVSSFFWVFLPLPRWLSNAMGRLLVRSWRWRERRRR